MSRTPWTGQKSLTVLMLAVALVPSSLAVGHATPTGGGRDRCWKAFNDVVIGRWWSTRLPPVEYPPDTRTEYRERVRWRFSVDQRNPRVIYIWNLWRAFKSTDGGCTWDESYNTITTASLPAPAQTDEIVALQAPLVQDADAPTYMVVQRGPTSFLGIEDAASGEWDIAPMTDATGPLTGRPVQFWVAPSDPRILYLEMGTDITLREDRYDRSRLYASEDGGRTWELRTLFAQEAASFTYHYGDLSCPAGPSPCPGVHVTAMEVHPEDPDVLWTGVYDGIFRSEDGGRSWQNAYRNAWRDIGPFPVIELVSAPSKPLRIAVFGVSGTGWSTDGGRTWELRDALRGVSEGTGHLLVTPIDSAASHDRSLSLAFLLGSGGGRQVQLLGPWGSTYVSPAPSRCTGERETVPHCLRLGAYVSRARSYFAVERDGSHLWRLERRS